MTQNEILIDLMKQGWVSPAMALAGAGCMRLAARVHDIKAMGYCVISRTVIENGRGGRKVRFKEYRIIMEESK
jgi:hypothetical protein